MGKASRKKRHRRDSVTGVHYSKFPNEKVLNKTRRFMNENIEEGIKLAKRLQKSHDGQLYSCLLAASSHNIFISSEDVLDLIENNDIKEKDIEAIFEVISNDIKDSWLVTKDGLYMYNIIVHLPNRKHSIFYTFIKNSQTDETAIGFMTGTDYFVETIDNGKVYELLNGHMPTYRNYKKSFKFYSKNKEYKNYWNILFNLFLYTDAFPECRVSGPPPIICDFKTATTIHATHKIIHETGVKMSPHLRRGHFRFLKSDVFKKKRYQTIYVKPTMINTTASHIIEGEKSA